MKVLRERFGSLAKAWKSRDKYEWRSLGFSDKEIALVAAHFIKINSKDVFAKIKAAKLEYVSYWDDDYPSMLKEIHGAPIVLYYQGDIGIVKQSCLAVVGTRSCSGYGQKIVMKFVPDLVKQNLVLVSGMALGIDSLVHYECIKAGGPTVAVLGGGIDVVASMGNGKLIAKIVAGGGLVMSEYGADFKPQPWCFPARNRIVSGLSRGVLVIEAPFKSGALITANLALEQNRSVLAVPGDIFRSSSVGCHELIKKGACLVQDIDDILVELGLMESKTKRVAFVYKPENELEAEIIGLLKLSDLYLDEVVAKTNVQTSELISALNILAMKGVVSEMSGGKWTLLK